MVMHLHYILHVKSSIIVAAVVCKIRIKRNIVSIGSPDHGR